MCVYEVYECLTSVMFCERETAKRSAEQCSGAHKKILVCCSLFVQVATNDEEYEIDVCNCRLMTVADFGHKRLWMIMESVDDR